MPIEPRSLSPSQRKVVWILILAIAATLRFWHLDAKPLWIDELFTSFYSLGQDPASVPLQILQPAQAYRDLLQLDPTTTPLAAAQAVTRYSNHPPIFFMLMHLWIQGWGTSITALRSLPVLFGVLLVGAVAVLGYQVNRSVAWTAAALMVVSPFAVYLSQEARHYTLPMLISTWALVTWLKLLRQIRNNKRLPWRTLGVWILLNGLGFYTHYFYVISVGVQWGIVLGLLLRWRSPRHFWGAILAAMALTGILYVGWLPLILHQGSGSDATQWLNPNQPLWESLLLPWVRTLAAWVMMVILLPVEQVPIWVSIPSGLIMLGVWGWGLGQVFQGWKQFRQGKANTSDQFMLLSLQIYVLGVLGLMMAIVYGLNKDLTLAPRYFFILYPALTVIMAVGWAQRSLQKQGIWVVAGLVSIILMGWNVTLLKPYLPEQVGQNIAISAQPTVAIMAAPEPVQRLLGLSYAFAIPEASQTWWGFTRGIPEDGNLRSQFQNEVALPPAIATLWLLEPHRNQPFPNRVSLARMVCVRTAEPINTQGTVQQRYRCSSAL